MDLGIVVVSYNTRELTCDCLASVYAALGSGALQAHVWVVDNASSDGSVEALRARFPQATVLASAANLGFAGATNLGVQQMLADGAQPRHLLLLNPDTLVAPDALTLLVDWLDRTPDAAVAGAQLCYADGSFQHGAFHFPTLLMALFDFVPAHYRVRESWLNGRYPRRLYARGEPFAIDHPLGAAMLVRWQAWEQVGALDEGYFMYCEEIDWCMRARSAGWRCGCVPRARVTHLGGQSAQQFRDTMFVALWRSRQRLFSRHYGRCYRWVVNAIVRWGMRIRSREARRALAQGRIGADEAAGRLEAYAQVRGLYGG